MFSITALDIFVSSVRTGVHGQQRIFVSVTNAAKMFLKIALVLFCFAIVGAFRHIPSSPLLTKLESSAENLNEKAIDDSIFGAEFSKIAPSPNENLYWKGKKFNYIPPKRNVKLKSTREFDNLRATFFSDAVLISVIGFSITWFVGSLVDAYSFGIGSVLGLAYSVLLAKYVERIGTAQRGRVSDQVRFAPVVLLIALYGKYKGGIAIIPELVGFFASFQLASLVQIFNENAYGEYEEE